jgi:hypothetical protein
VPDRQKGERQPMLETVDLILLGIKFDVHQLFICDSHIKTSKFLLRAFAPLREPYHQPRRAYRRRIISREGAKPPRHVRRDFPLSYARPFGLAGTMMNLRDISAFRQARANDRFSVNFVRFPWFFQ